MIITAVLFIAIIGLAIWYLARPEPLLVQGEADSTRIDIAARVSGRLDQDRGGPGQNVDAGTRRCWSSTIPNWSPNCTKPKPKNWSPTRNWSASRSGPALKSSPSAKPKSTAPPPT